MEQFTGLLITVQVPGAPDLAGDPGRPVDGRAAHAQEPHLQDRAGAAVPALHRQPRVQDQGGARAHAADRGGAPGGRQDEVHYALFNRWQYLSNMAWALKKMVDHG